MSRFHLGVDVGGTFTDAVLANLEDGSVRRCKVKTTPGDQSAGVVEAIRQFDIPSSEISSFTHGSTVAINALLERKGAKTGLICTEGTRDMLDMGGLVRPPGDELYDATWVRPHLQRPLVHRRYIRDIPERLTSEGNVHQPLDEDAVRGDLEFLREEGVESVAICLLHGFVNSEHEERVKAIVRETMPEAYVQDSSLRPVIGELDRTFAVVLNAYTGPVISGYLTKLSSRLSEDGFEGDILITQMNGGVRSLEHTLKEFPGYTIQSGPTAGLLGAQAYAREVMSAQNYLCVDIGGTSTDIGIVDEGEALRTDDWELEFGIRLGFPALDVRSIGAGGGSLIQLDELGTLRIGPESSGADPGPAAYQQGGRRPTMTDALVAMGVVRPELFLDGHMPLSRQAAVDALEVVAKPLDMTALQLATGAFNLMNAQVEQEISKVLFERAIDPTGSVLLAYGGAGPVHGASIARLLGIERVVVPYFPGGFSAFGMVAAPLNAEHAVSMVVPIDSIDPDRLQGIFDDLASRVIEDLEGQGVPREEITLGRSLHGHYMGQGFANRIPFLGWPVTDGTIAEWKQNFHRFYDRTYGYSAPELPIEVTTMTVTGSGRSGNLPLAPIRAGEARPAEEALALKGDVCLDGENWETIPFYHRQALLTGNRVQGPAVIDDGLSTILLVAGTRASVDVHGNVVIDADE